MLKEKHKKIIMFCHILCVCEVIRYFRIDNFSTTEAYYNIIDAISSSKSAGSTT